MKKSWWTIDRIVLVGGLMITLFGWGATWGILNTKVENQAGTISELEEFKADAIKNNYDQEIKINSNADAITYTTDLFRLIIKQPGTGEEGD